MTGDVRKAINTLPTKQNPIAFICTPKGFELLENKYSDILNTDIINPCNSIAVEAYQNMYEIINRSIELSQQSVDVYIVSDSSVNKFNLSFFTGNKHDNPELISKFKDKKI